MDIVIVGNGKIGHAIAEGLRRARPSWPVRILGRSDDCAPAGEADVVLLCVKPLQVRAALASLAPALKHDSTLVSVAAKTTLAFLRELLPQGVGVVRAMPNLPVSELVGMTALACESDATGIACAETIFSAMGRTVRVEERLMDAATAMNGCGPAYAYVIVEAWIDAGIKLGFSYETSRTLVAQTLLGAAASVLASDEHPAALKTAVTTPAGCTIEGLMQLEDGRIRSTIVRAIVAAAKA
uniref:Putative pyrroline-5-carboxylate reductase n=1 Tax=mine drainage metagenome TaxID=410659 RepID=E6Q0W9_9ZZZZ